MRNQPREKCEPVKPTVDTDSDQELPPQNVFVFIAVGLVCAAVACAIQEPLARLFGIR